MAKIIAPNAEYNGVSAGVTFVKGQAECEDEARLAWFEAHGYAVEADQAETEAGDMAKKRKGKKTGGC